MLTDVALRCPTPSQQRYIDEAYADHLLVTKAWSATSIDQREKDRAATFDRLAEEVTPVDIEWTADGPTLAEPSGPIELTRGLSRCVLLRLTNRVPGVALQLAARHDRPEDSYGHETTVLPGDTQGLLVELLVDDLDTATVEVTVERRDAATQTHRFKLPVSVVEPAVLRGVIVDSDRGEPWPGRLSVVGSDNQIRRGERYKNIETLRQKELLQFWQLGKYYQLPFFYSDGTFEVHVPPGEVEVTLERGFEHEIVTETLTVAPGETRELRLESNRFADLASQGWVSGDTHVHWVINQWDVDLPLDLLSVVQRAEGVRVANNLTLLQRGPTKAFINPQQGPMGTVASHSDAEFHVEMGEEYRNEDLYGHLCFLNLDWLVLPIGTGSIIAGPDALDYPINKTAILACREQGGISIEAHGLGGNKDVPVNVVHGLTDSLDQMPVDEYYRFLDCGFHLPLTNGSDHPARVLGCARAYVKIDGPFTYDKWIDGIRNCRTFTTSGPLISLDVNGAEIGDTLNVSADTPVVITARAESRRPIQVLEIVSNGEVIASKRLDARSGEVSVTIPAGESRWVVARCGTPGEGFFAFNAVQSPDVAHTSAVYVDVDGAPRFDPAAAEVWVDRMRQHIRDIRAKGRFANDSQRDEAVAYVEEGIARFETLMAEAAERVTPAKEPALHLVALKPEAQPESTASPWPIATPVNRQPLLVQTMRLAEALDYIGNPLPDATKQALKELQRSDADDAAVTARIEELLDPLCLAGVSIANGEIAASEGAVERRLVEQGWRSFLVKVCNDARLTTRLHVESPNARSMPHAKAEDVASRWMGLTMFDGRPMQASLSGLPLEYRIVQVYSRDAGAAEASVEFSIDAEPGTRGRLIREWRFDEGTDGWVAANQCEIEARDGSLHVEGVGGDPFITCEVGDATGELLLRFWAEAEADGIGQVFFWTEEQPSPDPNKVVTFALMPGSAQQYEAAIKVEGVLAGVRIDPNVKATKTRIDWIDLSYAHRRGETWCSLPMRFDAEPAVDVTVEVIDKHPDAAAAAFVIRDKLGRIYPEQSKRLAPDLFFHPQVYRLTGETFALPPGEYDVEAWRGPESIRESKKLVVGNEPTTLTHEVRRWIDPSDHGWWSGDHHIHAAGCLHYQNPTQGIHPPDMMRQIMGEDLHVGCCLTWGPCFDYQKRFFTGEDQDMMRYPYVIRYDVEVSGFGSHASGHLNLLRLKEQIYPGGDSKDHWPTLGLETLRWAKAQGAVTGTAHSGSGLTRYIDRLPYEDGPKGLPHFNVPAFDGIGANEYIVDATHELPGPLGVPQPALDFIATMNTPRLDEWNIWYHTLNCGYRIRASGETDFPCMSGERVGIGRVYVKVDGRLNYPDWVQGLQDGRSYVSDAKVHLMDFGATHQGRLINLGERGSELRLDAPAPVTFRADCAALIDSAQWGSTDAEDVEVELIVNGYPAATKSMPADGSIREIEFEVELQESSWVALRAFPHAHTNPIFVVVDGKPIRASKASAEWCLRSVDQCWLMKRDTYAVEEQDAARAAYDHARKEYARILAEAAE